MSDPVELELETAVSHHVVGTPGIFWVDASAPEAFAAPRGGVFGVCGAFLAGGAALAEVLPAAPGGGAFWTGGVPAGAEAFGAGGVFSGGGAAFGAGEASPGAAASGGASSPAFSTERRS